MDKKVNNEEIEKLPAPHAESLAEQKEATSAESSLVPKEETAAEIQKEKHKLASEGPDSGAQSDDDIKPNLQSENRLAALIKLVELKKVSVPDAIKQAEKEGADVLDRFHDLLVEKGFGKESKP